uniref:Uncharacterized protein n=1 Tax=Oryza punctata TaxID=4537 RepID=A0A0E0K3E9_ORYPU
MFRELHFVCIIIIIGMAFYEMKPRVQKGALRFPDPRTDVAVYLLVRLLCDRGLLRRAFARSEGRDRADSRSRDPLEVQVRESRAAYFRRKEAARRHAVVALEYDHASVQEERWLGGCPTGCARPVPLAADCGD